MPIENPFTRPSTEPKSSSCVATALHADGHFYSVTIANRCDVAVAVLTAPLETRLRVTGKEKFVNERMPWAAYALLYVVKSDLGKKAFVGDGAIRDGGMRVRQLPAYVSMRAGSTLTVPLRCVFEAPAGTYALSLATYEAPLGEAPPRSGAFDCTVNVDRYNAGHDRAMHISLGGDVREVQSTTIQIHIP